MTPYIAPRTFPVTEQDPKMLVLSSSVLSSSLLEDSSKKRRSPTSTIPFSGNARLKRQRSFEDVFNEGHRCEWQTLQRKQNAFTLAVDSRDETFVTGWRCANRECCNRDRSSLQMTQDKASMVCPQCGLVDGLAQPISQTFEAQSRTEYYVEDGEDSTRLGRFDSMLGTSDEKKAKRMKACSATAIGSKDQEMKRKHVTLVNERAKEIQRQQSGLSDIQIRRRDRVVTEISSIFKAGGRNVDRCPIFDASCYLATTQFARGIAHAAVCKDAGCKVGFASRRFTTISREAIAQTIESSLERSDETPIAGMTRPQLESVMSPVVELIRPYTSHPSSGVVRNELLALKRLTPAQLLEPCVCVVPELVKPMEPVEEEGVADTFENENSLFEAKLGIAFESIASLQFAPEHITAEARTISKSVVAFGFLATVRAWQPDLVAIMFTLTLVPSMDGSSRGAVAEYTRSLRTHLSGLSRNAKVSMDTIEKKLSDLGKVVSKFKQQQQTTQHTEAVDPWD